MARKAVETELSRERILYVARDLFASQGYRTVSMRSIGKELGYSHGALYYHFREKAELFYALIVEDFSILRQMLNEVLTSHNGSGVSKVEQVMLEFIRFGLEYRHHYEIMFLIGDPELQRYSRPEQVQCFERFATVVREATSEAAQNAIKETNLSFLLFLSIHGFITHYIHSNRTYEEVRDKAKEHVKFLCRGLS